DLPRFLGLKVLKYAYIPGQPEPVTSWLLDYDEKTGKAEASPALQAVLREAEFDEHLAGAPFAFQGLVMPTPKMSTSAPVQDGLVEYPKAELEGIDWENLIAGAPAAPGIQ